MKNTRRTFILVSLLAAIALMPIGVSAQSGGGYTTGFQLQNLEAQAATVTINYYDQAGATSATVNTTIAANGSTTYFPLSSVPTGFSGSVIVSSDRALASIVNVLTSDFAGGASYSGATSGATTVNLPLIMKANFNYNTWYAVQNAGSSSATVNVTYSGSSCTDTGTIAPGASKIFDQKANTCLAAGYVGAAKVTNASTNQPLVVAVMQIVDTAKTLLSYNGFTTSDESTAPVMPLVSTNWFGSLTGIQIQNTGASSTDVTMQFTPGTGFPGAACSQTKTVAAGASATFFLPMPAGCGTNQSNQTNAFVGSGKVTVNTGSMPLVAIVNQINTKNKTGSAYNGANPSNGTSKVSFPLIMDRNFGYFTGFSVANVGTSSTTVSCSFTNSTLVVSGTVASGAALASVQLNQLADKYVGSTSCTATGGDAKIVGVVNELGTGEDSFLTYNGTNN